MTSIVISRSSMICVFFSLERLCYVTDFRKGYNCFIITREANSTLLLNFAKGVMASHIRQTIPGSGWFRRIYFNERGYVALFIASHRGHAKVVSKLMGLGIDACHKIPSGRSAIHVAVIKKRVTCVNLLVGTCLL